MNTVVCPPHPPPPSRNVYLFSNLCTAHANTIKKEGNLINGDFKVVMRSTDINNCGETQKKEDCKPPNITHPHTHLTELHPNEHTCTKTFSRNHIWKWTLVMRSVAHGHINPVRSLEAFWLRFISFHWKIMKLHYFPHLSAADESI